MNQIADFLSIFSHLLIKIYFIEFLISHSAIQQRCYSVAANNFRTILQNQLEDIKAAGTFKTERVITTAQKSKIGVEGMSKQVLNFCANNYLGLSANEEIKDYAKDTLDKYGSGLSSVRFICGECEFRIYFNQRLSRGLFRV